MKRAVLSSLLALALAAPGLPAIAQEQKASHRGPPRERVEQTLSLVDYRRIGIEPSRIMLPPGMAITLNGIAQGYITDRVADLLGARGWTNVLIDLGELRGLGGHPDGRPWRTALMDPVDAGRIVTTVPLSEKSIATSCGAATRFEASGRHHHLFSPASGRSANTYEAVTVAAERATLADALSPRCSSPPPPRPPPFSRNSRASRRSFGPPMGQSATSPG